MTEHSPGPWLAGDEPSPGGRYMDDGGDYAIYVERNGAKHVIAEAFSKTAENNREPAEANARLIAASPEMKAALVAARATMVEWYVQDQADVIGAEQAAEAAHREVAAVRAIDAVLAKLEVRP